MAIKINLLPEAERQPCRTVTLLMALVAMATVMIVVVIVTFNTFSIWKLEKEIDAAEQQFSLLRPIQDKMFLANNQNQLIIAKNNLLTKLTAERKPWYAIMTRLSIITPTQIWLTELSAVDRNGIRIKGNALTYPDLANYLHQLEQDEMLTEPLLIKAERDDTLAVTRFEMTVKFKGIQP